MVGLRVKFCNSRVCRTSFHLIFRDASLSLLSLCSLHIHKNKVRVEFMKKHFIREFIILLMWVCVCASNVSNDMPCALSGAMTKMLAATAAECVFGIFPCSLLQPRRFPLSLCCCYCWYWEKDFMWLSHFLSLSWLASEWERKKIRKTYLCGDDKKSCSHTQCEDKVSVSSAPRLLPTINCRDDVI
jgi:hypothetical protein